MANENKTPTIVDKLGPSPKTIDHFRHDSIATALGITRGRRDIQGMRKRSYLTGNFATYDIENDEVVVYVGLLKGNFVFQDMKNVLEAHSKGEYQLPKERMDRVIGLSGGAVERIELSKLDLVTRDNQYSYFEIHPNTPNMDQPSQREINEFAFGHNNFEENMKMLNYADIQTTTITLLNPEHVRLHKNLTPIGRACMLHSFSDNSDFSLATKLSDQKLYIRGAPK